MPEEQLEEQQQQQEQEQQEEQEEQQEQEQKAKPFTPEQEQYLGSWLGRIVAKQLEPIKEGIAEKPILTPSGGDDHQTKFNETLQSKIFDGDPMSAINMALDVREQAKINFRTAQKAKADKSITEFSEQPYYKDIYQEMKTMTHQLVDNGIPPEHAASHAYQTSKANYLESLISDKKPPENLGVLGGGRRQEKKTPKLPPQFKAAAQRDIEQGLFKDEQEYIESLSPKIRREYGI